MHMLWQISVSEVTKLKSLEADQLVTGGTDPLDKFGCVFFLWGWLWPPIHCIRPIQYVDLNLCWKHGQVWMPQRLVVSLASAWNLRSNWTDVCPSARHFRTMKQSKVWSWWEGRNDHDRVCENNPFRKKDIRNSSQSVPHEVWKLCNVRSRKIGLTNNK